LLIGLCLVCFALATGWQYALGTSLRAGNVPAAAGSLYFADLAGSSAGALITVIWLVPVLGIMKAIAGITALNLLVVLVLPAKKKN
jgi:hypothetical protein